jgi:hypothetical protein
MESFFTPDADWMEPAHAAAAKAAFAPIFNSSGGGFLAPVA